MFTIVSNSKVAGSPVRLVRTASTLNWTVADTDMDALYVRRQGWSQFKPLIQALWLGKNRQRAMLPGTVHGAPYASRAFSGSVVETEDKGCVVLCKLGVKEVEASGVPFKDCNWGMYVVRLSKVGKVLWKGLYQIHKGNAQVVAGSTPGTVRIIATDGLCWVVDAATGAIVTKTSVPMGDSGEKSSATATACSFVGYNNHPSGVTRFGIDAKAIPVMNDPPYGTGGDMWRGGHVVPAARPKALWWAIPFCGNLLYNYVGPNKFAAKFSTTKLPSGGPADGEERHIPALFTLPNSPLAGIAVKDDGATWVQVLNNLGTRVRVGTGGWASAVSKADGSVIIRYMNGNDLYEAVVKYG